VSSLQVGSAEKDRRHLLIQIASINKMSDWEYYTEPGDSLDEVEERQRFQDSILKERSRYHSIALSEKQPANEGISSFDYKPSRLPDQHNLTFARDPRTALARFIPQDGRIKLAFDLHWQAETDEHDWKLINIGADKSWSNNEERQKFLQKKAKSKIESLESFGREIQAFGNFVVLDIDPSTPENGHVFYNLGCSQPYVVIQESIPGGRYPEPKWFIPLMILTSYNSQSNLGQLSRGWSASSMVRRANTVRPTKATCPDCSLAKDHVRPKSRYELIAH
jgi:hypothetical protein